MNVQIRRTSPSHSFNDIAEDLVPCPREAVRDGVEPSPAEAAPVRDVLSVIVHRRRRSRQPIRPAAGERLERLLSPRLAVLLEEKADQPNLFAGAGQAASVDQPHPHERPVSLLIGSLIVVERVLGRR